MSVKEKLIKLLGGYIEDEYAEWKESYELAEKSLNQATETIEGYKSGLASAEKERDAALEEKSKLEKSVEHYKDQSDELSRQVEELTDKLNQSDAMLGELEETKDEYFQTINDLTNSVSQKDEEIANLKKAVKEPGDDSVEKIAELEKSITAYKGQCTKYKNRIEELVKEIENAGGEIFKFPDGSCLYAVINGERYILTKGGQDG